MKLEDSIKEIQRKNLIIHSEYEKEKVLLIQKISFYEKNLEEANIKEQVNFIF